MPRKKAPHREVARPDQPFTGELAEPILKPFELPQIDADGKLTLQVGADMVAQLEKMFLLAEHYGVQQGNWFALALKLAIDFVPGFRVLYDDQIARELKLPNTFYGVGTKPKGSGLLPEWLSGEVLIWTFEAFRKKFPTESHFHLSQRIVAAFLPRLEGAAHKSERESVAKTLQNRLSKAKASHPIS